MKTWCLSNQKADFASLQKHTLSTMKLVLNYVWLPQQNGFMQVKISLLHLLFRSVIQKAAYEKMSFMMGKYKNAENICLLSGL